MRRRFLFFFFVVNLFLIACGRKELRNDLQQLYLQGEIKQIRTSSYTVLEKFDQIEKKSKTTERENTLLTFNEKGNQVEKTLFSPTDKPTRIYTYLYDMKGNRALVNETLDDGTLKKRYIYTYDDKGNRTEINTYSGDGIFLQKEKRTYDEKQNPLEEDTYNGKGELEQKQINIYDEKGLCIESNLYTPSGELKNRYTYSYDENKNMLERKKYDKNGKILANHTYTYSFDKRKNWTQRIEYLNGKAIYLTEREIEYGVGAKEQRQPVAQMDTAPQKKFNYTVSVKNDWTAQELKGAVKTLRVRTYNAQNHKQKDKGQNTLTIFSKEGYLTRITYYDKDNIYSYEKKFSYQYNDKGYRREGKMLINESDYLVSTYDDKGYIIGGYLFQNNTQFEQKASYDDSGNMTSYYLGDVEITYIYDKNHQLIEEKHKNGGDAWDIRYSRGKNGSILEEEIYRKGILDEKKTYIYTFDERGNWTERTQYKNRTPVEITERVIEYY